jgi:hypothetical protein
MASKMGKLFLTTSKGERFFKKVKAINSFTFSPFFHLFQKLPKWAKSSEVSLTFCRISVFATFLEGF